MVNSLSSLILSVCECILFAEDPDYSLSCFHYLVLLTNLSSVYKNNLLIDSIIHLLVDLTHLSLHFIPYSTSLSNVDTQQSSSTNLLLTRREENEPLSPRSSQHSLVYVEYNPLSQLMQFRSPISTKAYNTLLMIISQYGDSIQKGYNEIVPFSVMCWFLDSTILFVVLLWYY